MSGDIAQMLFALQDSAYGDFQSALMPSVARERVIGVRTPALRAMARHLRGTQEAEAFLSSLPHAYYEEDNLHAFLIGEIRDFDACVRAVDRFLPYVDNWATCDGMNPKAFGRCADALTPWIDRWLSSQRPYTVRFGLVMLMKLFLGERFDASVLERAAAVRSGEYYVRMAAAWLFAEALGRRYEDALPYIRDRRLDAWVHNKAIQKATESRVIPPERKAYLKTLRRARTDD